MVKRIFACVIFSANGFSALQSYVFRKVKGKREEQLIFRLVNGSTTCQKGKTS